jgi:hypothetical protein
MKKEHTGRMTVGEYDSFIPSSRLIERRRDAFDTRYRSFPVLWTSRLICQLTEIFRGLAFSDFGRTSVITPSRSSALIRSWSILLET